MGSICSMCFESRQHSNVDRRYASEKTPLLTGSSPGIAKDVTQVTSARHKSPISSTGEDVAENFYKPIAIQRVGLDDIDKQFMDHANLYNEYLMKWNKLNEHMINLRDAFQIKPNGTITDTMKILKIKLVGAEIVVRRKFQYCIELQYDKKSVEEELDEVLNTFNIANRITKDILDKGPMLLQSIDLVLKNEDRGKRDILVYSADEEYKAKGPEMLKVYMNNYMELKKVPSTLNAIKIKCTRYFEDLKNSAQQLLIDDDFQI